jgi:hypothetical protein
LYRTAPAAVLDLLPPRRNAPARSLRSNSKQQQFFDADSCLLKASDSVLGMSCMALFGRAFNDLPRFLQVESDLQKFKSGVNKYMNLSFPHLYGNRTRFD